MRLERRLWTEENVTFASEHFQVADATVEPGIQVCAARRHPRLYFGGASERQSTGRHRSRHSASSGASRSSGSALRGSRRSRALDRDLPPLEFGLHRHAGS